MNKNKMHKSKIYKRNSSQASSIETAQSKTRVQVKTNDQLISLDEATTRKQVEVDNPNFVLGYN